MKRKTVWLALSLVAVVGIAFTVQAQDHAFVGASKCKMCHKVQFASWEQTSHAAATDSAKASTDREYTAECLTCHATNSDENLAGVQCEACHGAGADFKKMSIMKDREKAIANGLAIPAQATCDACHTGEDHSSKKVLADEVNNNAAIHEFKNPPA